MKSPSWPLLIGSVLVLAVLAVYGLAKRLGAFEGVKIDRKVQAPLKVLSKDHMGAYHKIAAVISEVESWARKNGEPCVLSFGEYFDNPESVDEDRLRSRGGCIIEKALAAPLPSGYSISEIPARDAVIAEFGGSPSIGPWKVYPAVFDFLKAQDLAMNGPTLEIYQVLSESSGRTQYVFPVKDLRKP